MSRNGSKEERPHSNTPAAGKKKQRSIEKKDGGGHVPLYTVKEGRHFSDNHLVLDDRVSRGGEKSSEGGEGEEDRPYR